MQILAQEFKKTNFVRVMPARPRNDDANWFHAFTQERVVETSLLLKLKENIDADEGWFVSVDAH
jgi:hypothetical protein